MFLTDRNETLAISVPRAEPTRTQQQIVEAMNAIIASNAVQSVRGIPSSRYLAELLTTVRTEVDIFAS
jgi:DNA-binding transcriptional regulator YhcF (GntR family)